jgi:light-regulated signal transduction histidine kinase (bacteriophytochrome)
LRGLLKQEHDDAERMRDEKIQRELEAANRRLASMALELERSNQELEQFARSASHDLSAPITSTRWLVDLLISRHSDGLDDSGRKILKQISQGLERMSDLVDAVLAHARMGTSAIGSQEAVPAANAVDSAIENLRKHVELSGAAVHSRSLPAVNIDKNALTQLFQNLLSNAIKYRQPTTPPVIEISAAWKQPHWEFAVRDNGIGIEREWHQRIFQPMQRRHGMEIAGSGIGLATCMKIVTRAGGEIWVESEPDQGSTFRFTLPGPAPAGS